MSSALEIGFIPEEEPSPARSLEVVQTVALGHEALAPVIELIPVPEGTPLETYFFIGNEVYFLCRDGRAVSRYGDY